MIKQQMLFLTKQIQILQIQRASVINDCSLKTCTRSRNMCVLREKSEELIFYDVFLMLYLNAIFCWSVLEIFSNFWKNFEFMDFLTSVVIFSSFRLSMLRIRFWGFSDVKTLCMKWNWLIFFYQFLEVFDNFLNIINF